MTVPPHVSLITLGVRDLAATSAFYEALGWRRSSASVEGEVVFLALRRVAFALWGLQDLADDAGVAPGAPGAVALAMNLPDAGEVQEVLAAAAAAGATVTKPATPTSWGGTSGYFADPEGHLWEVAHNPFWSLDEDGAVTLP